MFAGAAHRRFADDVQVAGGEGERRIAGAKRRELFQGFDQRQVDLRQLEEGIHHQLPEHRLAAGLRQDGAVEPSVEGDQVLGAHAQAGGHAVPTKPGYQLTAGRDGLGDIDTLHRARRSARQLAFGRAEQDGRPVIQFDQPVGHNADHAGGPFGMRQYQCGFAQQGRVAFHLGPGSLEDLIGKQFAARIQALQSGRGDVDQRWIAAGQEVNHRVGIFQAADGVEARTEDEADMGCGQVIALHIGLCQHGTQRRSDGRAHLLQSALHQVAGFAAQQGQVSHRSQRGQVGVLGQFAAQSRAGEQGFNQFEGGAHAAQRVERMLGIDPLRIDHGMRGWQGLWKGVMVGDDHIHTLFLRIVNRFVRGDAGIAG